MKQIVAVTTSLTAVLALLLTAGCGPKSGADSDSDSSPSASPAGPAMSPAAPSEKSSNGVIRYGKSAEDEVFVQQAADVEKLTGASADFKSFIADQVTALSEPTETDDCEVGIGVQAYDPSGFALGHISACGGYVALWGKGGGSWKELIGTQELWACSDLRKHKIPTGLVDTCYESMKEVPYTG